MGTAAALLTVSRAPEPVHVTARPTGTAWNGEHGLFLSFPSKERLRPGSHHGGSGRRYLCAGCPAVRPHVRPAMEAMAGLLAADRAPAEVRPARAAEVLIRGRNAPCSCASGRLWKQCHGAAPAC